MRIELPKNLEDVEGGFEVLPPATYQLEVDNVESKTSKADKPYLNMTYKVVDDPDYAGRKLFDSISLSTDALWRLKDFTMSIGVDVTTEFDTEDFLGADFSAVVDIKKGEQKPQTTGDNPDDFYPEKNVIKTYVPRG